MTISVICGDSRDVLKTLGDETVDSVVCDPPYALVSIGKRFGDENAAPAKEGKTGAYARASSGFMGQKWDTGETAFAVEFWAEVMRVLKPGGHVVAFSGTRTYHRLAVAIEDAGFEIRDMISWLYGSGFPKSHNQKGAFEGWGTALKPACEPIVLARKPLVGTVAANVIEHGTGAINVDGCRVGEGTGEPAKEYEPNRKNSVYGAGMGGGEWDNSKGRWPANVVHDGSAFDQDFSRYFYTAKADATERLGSKHPTVKPVDLMRWLCRLVTPPGGLIVDPFAGSGTTGVAAHAEGFNAIMIEREPDFAEDARRRISWAMGEAAHTSSLIRKPAPRPKADDDLF